MDKKTIDFMCGGDGVLHGRDENVNWHRIADERAAEIFRLDSTIDTLKAEVESSKQDYINTGLDLADARREISRLKSENKRLKTDIDICNDKRCKIPSGYRGLAEYAEDILQRMPMAGLTYRESWALKQYIEQIRRRRVSEYYEEYCNLHTEIDCLKAENQRLRKAIEDAFDYANGRQYEWGSRAETTFEILEKALEGGE